MIIGGLALGLGLAAVVGIWAIAEALNKIHGELVRIGGCATPFLDAINRISPALHAAASRSDRPIEARLADRYPRI